jgi:5-methyltetrahydropteroyltriglutamate--homocysteine methyltransferase
MLTHVPGFPRIGLNRELKKATEAYWKGNVSRDELEKTAAELRQRHWQLQKDEGLDLVSVGDFSLYDHMLDMTATLGAVPLRYEWEGGQVDLDTYFRMARGGEGVTAMEMTKWFDTNYHYIVPEFHPGQSFQLSSDRLFEQAREAQDAGFEAKVVLPGPLSYIFLGKSVEETFDRWEHLDAIVSVYEEILRRLEGLCTWVQIDEPVLVLDIPNDVRQRFLPVYKRLSGAAGELRLLLAAYFGGLGNNAETALALPVDGLHIDLVRDPDQLSGILDKLPAHKTLSLGVVNGRNIWRADLHRILNQVAEANEAVGSERLMVASSCSLLHVPIDLEAEAELDSEVKNWMAFARQKCHELRVIADAVAGLDVSAALQENENAWAARRGSPRVADEGVRERMEAITEDMLNRTSSFDQRKPKQQEHLKLPAYPTTTIGSFPQTKDIRAARRKFKKGEMDEATYVRTMQDVIRDDVARQEELDLDVLVHGEPERNDMVEYFGEQLNGYCFTRNGWVQSYGSRCVKPPVIYGDVSRPKAMTVEWTTFAQSLTERPMKGMLTGPVTMLCWSFVRDDQPRSETCRQLALAIRDEVADLEEAGIKVIQIDEPALREGLPLRQGGWKEYLEWAVGSFRLSTSCVRDETQIHTHMCYSEFNEIVEWIAAMDADVISIEASRSRMTLLQAFRDFKYPNDIGPGVYDIHSPRVPPADEMVELLHLARDVIPADRLWVNPDCGLKTRGWPETIDALSNMVAAAKILREEG